MIKRVEVEILHPDTHKVIRRYRIKPSHTRFFLDEEVDAVLDDIIETFDKVDPSHKYHLVPLGKGRFRFVWREEATDDQSGD